MTLSKEDVSRLLAIMACGIANEKEWVKIADKEQAKVKELFNRIFDQVVS